MSSPRLYEAAFPYADDILALPVADIERASAWYCDAFGFTEVERRDSPGAYGNTGARRHSNRVRR